MLVGYRRGVAFLDVLTFGPQITRAVECVVAGYDPSVPVVSLRAARSDSDLALSAASGERLQYVAKELIGSCSQHGKTGMSGGPGRRFELVDVVATLAGGPVRLAIINKGEAVVWSFKIAEGAQIVGVTLIVGTVNGVLYLPRDVPVEIIDDPSLDRCGLMTMVHGNKPLAPNADMTAMSATGKASDPMPVRASPGMSVADREALTARFGTNTFDHWQASFEPGSTGNLARIHARGARATPTPASWLPATPRG